MTEALIKLFIVLVLFYSVASFAKEDGRYKLYTFPQYVNRSILLDTQTGRMWTDKCLKQTSDGKDCKFSAWTEDKIVGVNTDWQKLAKEHAEIEKAETASSGETK